MPKRSRESCDCEGAAATAGNDDRLGSLPDDALLLVLSLLPSEDAVRTCVLARRWRHLWRFTAALHIARDDDKRWSVRWLHRFVTNFLRLRDSLSPLDVCDIFCRPFVWSTQAFCFKVAEEWHLTWLELGEVEIPGVMLDLSGCMPCTGTSRADILQNPGRQDLSDNWGFTPVLESMSSLAKAFVRFDDECCDKCPRNYYGDCGHGDCDGCYGNLYYDDDEDNQCVLLGGLSGTTNLELIALPEVFVCRKDFKWRPIFRNLKTLLLNEWPFRRTLCVADDFRLLIYFLQHSPILEKLTLQLSKVPQPVVKAIGCHSPREGSMVSKCLKAIEVKYQEDGVLDKLLMILNTYGVSSEVVTIQKKDSLSSEKYVCLVY
ncbi:hypothetical protein BDA96_05G121500 [Sorghum bicolor]|uniref:F-box domain-containing protein n=1 Tax=Sorghum bicolor TaxID=4558 RepID=A0A921QY19_SORBI|nr:hypothetical protein BDA96_05G121500 [Sorghum bicolor]